MIYVFKAVLVIVLVTTAVIGDYRRYKISNRCIIAFTAIGIAVNIAFYGFQGLLSSICGIMLPFFLLLFLFAARMLGAGDIKLFCAIGSIMGWRYVLYCMAFSFIAGGVIALSIMLKGKNVVNRIKYFISYLKCCLLSASIMPYSDFSMKKDGSKMRFSYAVSIGTVVYQIYSVLK